MPKDFSNDSRSPGGLAPLQPNYDWEKRANHYPNPGADSFAYPSSSQPYHPASGDWPAPPGTLPEDVDPYAAEWPVEEEDVVYPPTPRAAVDVRRADTAPQRRGWSEPEWDEEDDYAEGYVAPQPSPSEAAPAAARSAVYRAQRGASRCEPTAQELLMQEVGTLLISVIRLHQGEWKLASIRANEEKDRLEAFLIPQNKRLELKEAIRRNQYMVITVDRQGNTKIREPKQHGPLRRFTRWLFGGD